MPTVRHVKFRKWISSKRTALMLKRRLKTLRAKSNNGNIVVKSVKDLGTKLNKRYKTRKAKVQIDRCVKYDNPKKGFSKAIKIAIGIGGTLTMLYVLSTFSKKADLAKAEDQEEKKEEKEDQTEDKDENTEEEENEEDVLGIQQVQLLKRMNTKLNDAYTNMRQLGKKTGHWAWWAFPIETPGRSEPLPKTCVTMPTARTVIKRAPNIWRKLLELVCELAEKDGKDVLPSLDHWRVRQFILFWEKVERTPKWMQSVLTCLKRHFWST